MRDFRICLHLAGSYMEGHIAVNYLGGLRMSQMGTHGSWTQVLKNATGIMYYDGMYYTNYFV